MRLLGRLLAGLVALLLVAALAGAWALPRLIDWNEYRGEFERLATETLGREVRLSGDFEFRLLPDPELSVRGLSMADPGDGFALAAPELRLSVGLWPLVVGRVQVNELVVAGAEIRLRPTGSLLDGEAVTPPRWLRRARLRLVDARIHLGALVAERVSARVVASGMRGPWSTEGAAFVAGRQVRFNGTLGQLGRDGTATIDLVLGQGPGSVTLGGIVNLVSGSLSGRAQVATPDLGAHLPAPRVPLRAEGRVTGGPDSLAFDDIAGELAGTPINGALSIRLSPELRIDLAAAANTIALDGWIEALGNATASFAGPPVAIDLSAEGASLWSGSIRRPRLSIVLADGQIAINEAEALLPGGTRVAASGAVNATPEGPRFQGLGEVSSPNLRATLDWLGLDTTGLPALTLRSAELSGRVMAERTQVEFAELDGRVDATRLAGGIVLRPGARLAFGAGLRLDRVRLADLWGDAPPDLAQLGRSLAGLNANLRIELDELELDRVVLAGVGLDATFERGQLAVRRATVADAGGMQLELRGGATLGERIELAETVVEATIVDGARATEALGLLGFLPPAAVEGAGRGRLSLAGPAEALQVDLGLELGGAVLEAKGAFALPIRRYAGTLSLHHPSAVRTLRRLALGDHQAWLGEGSLSAIGRVTLAPDVIEIEPGARLTLGGLRAGIAGRVERTSRWRLGLLLDAERLPLPQALPDPGRTAELLALLDGSLVLRAAELFRAEERLLQSVDAVLGFGEGDVAIEKFEAALASGRLVARGRYLTDASLPPRFEIEGSVDNADLTRALTGASVDIAAGRVDLTFDLASTGHGIDGLTARLAGTASLLAEDGVLLGFDLRAASAALAAERQPVPEVVRALSGGGTAFERLSAELRIGAGQVVVQSGELAAGPAFASLGGAVSLPGRSLDLRVEATLDAGVPPVRLSLTGPAAAPRAVVETAPLERWLAGARP